MKMPTSRDSSIATAQGQPRAPSSRTPATQEQKTTSPLPAVSLPKGDGAIRGISEKFSVNAANGTATLNIPLPISATRGEFGPQLALSYDSGSGNGPFGFGWHLSLPSITRKTDKGLPRYDEPLDSDIYLVSSAEDLVPEFAKDAAGKWLLDNDGRHVISEKPRTISGITYTVRRYRPRVEGLFARIERWTNNTTGEIHWRLISRDNVRDAWGQVFKCSQ